jgi:hypothetical protein
MMQEFSLRFVGRVVLGGPVRFGLALGAASGLFNLAGGSVERVGEVEDGLPSYNCLCPDRPPTLREILLEAFRTGANRDVL